MTAKEWKDKTVKDIAKRREQREHDYMAYQHWKSKRTNKAKIVGER